MKEILNLGYYIGVSEKVAKESIIEFKKTNRNISFKTLTIFAFDTMTGVVVKVIETKNIEHMTKQVGSKTIIFDVLKRLFKDYFGAGANVHVISDGSLEKVMLNLQHNIENETGFDLQMIKKDNEKVFSLNPHDWRRLC